MTIGTAQILTHCALAYKPSNAQSGFINWIKQSIFVKIEYMSLLVRIGLFGLILVFIITSVVVLVGGLAIYSAPLAIPFSVMILIGISNSRSQKK